ncbi:MAG: hypothetical protein IPH76_18860 [Xanthomonadales bacterium]|nr:hypothetical protein [Xanthomonadales bacterium]
MPAGVDYWLHIMLLWRPLLAGAALLALVNAAIQIAARSGRVAPLTPTPALDIGVLSRQPYWAGGSGQSVRVAVSGADRAGP